MKKTGNNLGVEECSAFNLNYPVRVKLRDKGYQRLADLHNSFCGKIPSWVARDADYYRAKADSEGYTSMQGWDFIQSFGEVTNLGMTGYYDIVILIKNKDLKPQ